MNFIAAVVFLLSAYGCTVTTGRHNTDPLDNTGKKGGGSGDGGGDDGGCDDGGGGGDDTTSSFIGVVRTFPTATQCSLFEPYWDFTFDSPLPIPAFSCDLLGEEFCTNANVADSCMGDSYEYTEVESLIGPLLFNDASGVVTSEGCAQSCGAFSGCRGYSFDPEEECPDGACSLYTTIGQAGTGEPAPLPFFILTPTEARGNGCLATFDNFPADIDEETNVRPSCYYGCAATFDTCCCQ
uniref:Apple domain-containing protein n=1 Tax=Grammatophora oceanica TaxID=210454 RepID=A0A7S1YM90_9STRA|mmetsp:Transcript_5866/g.8333  ORF Transcript_5866/g.8333 Transcript_5866/m.8333 type:complete len:239 (+) Transcript_5866:57-773(+)